MNSLFRLIPAIMLGLCLSPTCTVQADSHGHIIHRDHDGNCSEDDDSDSDDDCDSESSDEDCHHAWAHHQKEIEPGFEEEDLTYEVDQDTAWPSKRENFSEMFR